MTEQDPKVITVDFKPRDGDIEPGMRVKRRDYVGGCQHNASIFDEELRKIECKDCGERLDPFTFLLRLAADWERYATQVKYLRDEVARRHQELEALKRQDRNLRASIRRRGCKPPAPGWFPRTDYSI
jgi:hypothetical protein